MEIWCWSIALLLKVPSNLTTKAPLWNYHPFSNTKSPQNPHDPVGYFVPFISRFIPAPKPCMRLNQCSHFFWLQPPIQRRVAQCLWLLIGFWDGHLHKQRSPCCFKKQTKTQFHQMPGSTLNSNFSLTNSFSSILSKDKTMFYFNIWFRNLEISPQVFGMYLQTCPKDETNLPNQLNWLNFGAFFCRSLLFFEPFLNNYGTLNPSHHPYISPTC